MIGASRRSWAWARIAVALAVMLVAVLPHATLAASSGFAMNHAPVLPAAHGSPAAHDPVSAHEHHARPEAAASACHDSAPAHDRAAPMMPACCILGCGLLAVAPDIRAATTAPAWLIRPATFADDSAGRTTEPAERPPRTRPIVAPAT